MKKIDRFRIDGKVAVITGGAGLLGTEHAKAIAQSGGIPLLCDIDGLAAKKQAALIAKEFDVSAKGYGVDITNAKQIKNALKNILKDYGRVDILINNAARDPKVDRSKNPVWSRLENFSVDFWNKDIAVGLTGAFLCSQVIGTYMAEHGGGIILNISSDLGLISPDQRIYKKDGLPKNQQPVKPVSYSVVKHGLIGLTKYLATYWAEDKVRAAVQDISQMATVLRPRPTLHILADEPDNRILECAIAAQAEFVVSGDRHLLALKHHADITMISLADFLAKFSR